MPSSPGPGLEGLENTYMTCPDDTRHPESPSPPSIIDRAPSPITDRTTTLPRITSLLRPGARFAGTQKSDRQIYNVQVELQHVDLDESFICGHLRIQGLTDDHPTLTTYFGGEIVGSRYKFATQHPEWGSSETLDMQHWSRFEEFAPLRDEAKRAGFTLDHPDRREHLYMRWKEYFLVPDHRVKTITGASFEGFYYICFNQSAGTVKGVYFHAKSEKFQQLLLTHVDDRGCLGTVQLC